jgi:ATP-dependent DNA ligase
MPFGNDRIGVPCHRLWSGHFAPCIFEAVAKLPVRSCLIDGEAIVYDQNELAVFDLICCGALASAVLCAFDLLELDGLDLRKRMVLHGNE